MSKYFIPSRAERRKLMAYMRFRMIDGRLRMFADERAHDWVRTGNYRSKTNGLTLYTTYLWDNGLSSCNCPGWANRNGKATKAEELKSCDHCKRLSNGDVGESMTSVLFDGGRPVTQVKLSNGPGAQTRLIGGEV